MNAQDLRDRSQKFSLEIIDFCDGLPRDDRTREMAEQLQAAATSAAQNYRAACRARSPAEFISKICITVEEADEVQGWIEILIKSRKAAGQEANRLLRESTELLKIFAASKRTAIRNQSLRRKSPNRKITKPNNHPIT